MESLESLESQESLDSLDSEAHANLAKRAKCLSRKINQTTETTQ
jgi:hypothetical protein